uniref:XK-related protein n=1 Tax=Trichuris muris TaxID=70415 RepID=A0A5S6QXJ8_TRIMR
MNERCHLVTAGQTAIIITVVDTLAQWKALGSTVRQWNRNLGKLECCLNAGHPKCAEISRIAVIRQSTNKRKGTAVIMDQMTSSSYSVSSDRRCFVEPPNSFAKIPSKQMLILGGCLCSLGMMWLAVTISLYGVTVEYYASLVYEARWLPAALFLSGIFCLLLRQFKFESLFISCATYALYNFACCQVVFVVYAVNLHRSLHATSGFYEQTSASLSSSGLSPLQATLQGNFSAPTTALITASPLTQAKLYYVKLCVAMCIICILGLLLGAILIWRLCRIALCNYVYTPLPRSLTKFFCTSGTVLLCLTLFSCYFAFQVLSLPFSYVHTYMIQELLCSLTLVLQTVLQFVLVFRPNRLLLKVMLLLNVCQFIQETFYSWNSYYISLYIHSSKAKLAIDLSYDQTVMTINFVAHFIRAVVSACSAVRLASVLDVSLRWALPAEKVALSNSLYRVLIAITCVYLLLAICHVAIDICYTAMIHIYRTLVAFTGISVLYLTMIGISLSYYVRSKADIALALTAVFVLMTMSVSAHALYVYTDTSLSKLLLNHLETLGRDMRQPSMMHFAEACLAFVSLVVSLVTAFLLFRVMHVQSARVPREPGSPLARVLVALWYCALLLLLLTTAEALINVLIRQNWQLFDNTVAYNVLGIFSMYLLSAVQLHVSFKPNNHFAFPLIVLFFLLLFEVLTTFNYLSSYTNYMQLLIVLNRLTSSLFESVVQVDQPAHNQRAVYSLDVADSGTLLPLSQVSLLLVSHAIQLIQWALTLVSITLVAVAFELVLRNRESRLKAENINGQSPSVMNVGEIGYTNEIPIFP